MSDYPLPCPFCGGINIVHVSHHMDCWTCGCEGANSDDPSIEAATAAWNQRTPALRAAAPKTQPLSDHPIPTPAMSAQARSPADAIGRLVGCWCEDCNPGVIQMFVCPQCGCKRCPRAGSHTEACTAQIVPANTPSGVTHTCSGCEENRQRWTAIPQGAALSAPEPNSNGRPKGTPGGLMAGCTNTDCDFRAAIGESPVRAASSIPPHEVKP